MRYFPMFFDSYDKKVLVVGGGKVALQKLLVLQNFEFKIKVVGQKIDKKIHNICTKKGYEVFERSFEDDDLIGTDIVIAAIDDVELQRKIYDKKDKNMLVNCVDLPQFCDFIFGSIFEKEGVVVAISSQAKAPSISKALKERLKKAVPRGLSKLISKIEHIRSSESAGNGRMEKIKRVTKKWFDKH